jgi:uncharacterized oligopeptide transporter (OPT) family protein
LNARPVGELNVRSVAVGILVAAFVGTVYPYIVLKLGFGPTVSVVSAFIGYVVLGAVSAVFGAKFKSNRFEYNIVQTAGTASAQSAFMCVLLASFDLLAAKPELGFAMSLSAWQVFAWISVAGTLGVLLAVPLRKHYIDEENLRFPDGTAVGEAMVLLDQESSGARYKVRMLGIGAAVGALSTWFRDATPRLIPEATKFGEYFGKLNVGIGWSALSFGSGALVGLRVTLSMGLGTLASWVLLPPWLASNGYIAEPTFGVTLRWVMWPATGMLVAGGLTALALKWKVVAKTFGDLTKGGLTEGTDVPLKWVGLGCAVLSIALIVLQWLSLGVAPWESALAILFSVPIMLVGIRVLGETNWAPISALANLMQVVFAAIAPGSIGTNMVASGMSGTVAGSGEHLMQDYRAGQIIGSNNRSLTAMQLIATPVGAAAVAIVYPLLRAQYGVGPERFGLSAEAAAAGAGPGLSSPISVKWAGFAELLMGGLDKLPKYALHALVISLLLGVVLTILEGRFKQWCPSPTGMALGMLIPGLYVLPMVLGALASELWRRARPQQQDAFATPLASGLIVGEALLAVALTTLAIFGLRFGAGGGGH